MRLLSLFALSCVLGLGFAAEEEAADPSQVVEEKTVAEDGKTELVKSDAFIGKFNWSNKKHADQFHDIKAVFTPGEEDNSFNVSFYFDWRKKPHVYTGIATGKLIDGELSGTVKNDDKRRTFTFTGTCAKGVFSGTHKELKGRHEVDTGTITFSPEPKQQAVESAEEKAE